MIDGTPEEVVAVTAAFAIPFAFLLGALAGGISGRDCGVDRRRRWLRANRR